MNMTINQSVSPVNHVASKCIGAEGAAAKNIAVKRAGNVPTDNGKNQERNGSMETQRSSVTPHFYVKGGYVRTCDYCGKEYTAKRDTSRFCHRRCRVNSHRAGGAK